MVKGEKEKGEEINFGEEKQGKPEKSEVSNENDAFEGAEADIRRAYGRTTRRRDSCF